MQRRELLVATGGIATAALAGCSGGGGSDDGDDGSDDDGSSGDGNSPGDDNSDSGGDGSTPDYDTEEAIQTLRSYITAEDLSTARNLLHTRSTLEVTTAGEVVEQEYSVLEENVERERVAELLEAVDDLDESDLDAIAEGVVLLIEADLTFEIRDQQTSDTQQFVLATENSEWRIVDRAVLSG
jgi:hypothetical protein